MGCVSSSRSRSNSDRSWMWQALESRKREHERPNAALELTINSQVSNIFRSKVFLVCYYVTNLISNMNSLLNDQSNGPPHLTRLVRHLSRFFGKRIPIECHLGPLAMVGSQQHFWREKAHFFQSVGLNTTSVHHLLL